MGRNPWIEINTFSTLITMTNLSKKRNYKLTANRAKINTSSVWPSYLGVAVLSIFIGFGVTFYYFDGGKSISFLLKIDELENLNVGQEKELLELKLDLQLSQISYEKIAVNLREAKDENTKLKESILFYEKIVGKRR
jgi:uncharacterized protein YfdQ (DUF2303 family)